MRAGGSGIPGGRAEPSPRQGSPSRDAGILMALRLTHQSIGKEKPMRAAAVQLTAKADKAENLEKADRLVRRAAGDGAELVVLPEKWTALGTGDDLRAAAEPIGSGEASTWAAGVARELGIDLVAGSISERMEGEDKLRNTSLHYGPDGELKAAYRKIHMFDVEVGGVEYRESDNEDPGEEAVLTATSDGVEIGLTVCYDLRFPELYRLLAVDGARILTVPAAFTVPTTRDHWEPLVRARAIENQAFVIAANQIGKHPPNHRSGGRSLIVDPWGIVLAAAPDSECVITADLDLEAQADIRRRLPSLANRRPNAYRRASAPTFA
jgi:deaminated glutathione amidase